MCDRVESKHPFFSYGRDGFLIKFFFCRGLYTRYKASLIEGEMTIPPYKELRKTRTYSIVLGNFPVLSIHDHPG